MYLSTTVYATLEITSGVSSSDSKYSSNDTVTYIISGSLSTSGNKTVRYGNNLGSWNEVKQIAVTSSSTNSRRPYMSFDVALKHLAACNTGYFIAPSFWCRVRAYNDAGSTGYYCICIYTAGTKSSSSTNYGKVWGPSSSVEPSNTNWS